MKTSLTGLCDALHQRCAASLMRPIANPEKLETTENEEDL